MHWGAFLYIPSLATSSATADRSHGRGLALLPAGTPGRRHRLRGGKRRSLKPTCFTSKYIDFITSRTTPALPAANRTYATAPSYAQIPNTRRHLSVSHIITRAFLYVSPAPFYFHVMYDNKTPWNDTQLVLMAKRLQHEQQTAGWCGVGPFLLLATSLVAIVFALHVSTNNILNGCNAGPRMTVTAFRRLPCA